MSSIRREGREPALPLALRPEPAVSALRDAARRSLEALLEGRPLPDLPQEAQVALMGWIDAVSVNGPLLRAARNELALPGNFGSLAKLSDLQSALLARAMADRLHLARWLQRGRQLARNAWSRWRNRRGKAGRRPLSSPPLAPPGLARFGPALVAAAFQDAEFQHFVSTCICAALSRKVIFHPDGPPVVILSDQTLLALTLAGMNTRTRQGTASAFILLDRLIEQPDWAGFWDQWIFVHIKQVSAMALPEALLKLPLLLDKGALHRPEIPDPPQAVQGWRETLPGYCIFLMDGAF